MDATYQNRRRFIQTTAAAASLAAFPHPGFAAEPSKKIRIGVIGCGSVSRMYFPNLKESRFVEIVSACDIIPERALAAGTLGSVGTAHASYGHLGPHWASFFYEKNGGSLCDLGVYQLTFLTGLFGPAMSVTAMTSIVTPKREIEGKGEITVAEEDNAVVTMAHAGGVISHTESSFNFFNPNDHAYAGQDHHTLTVTGRKGVMKLAGYDWGPHGVDLSTADVPAWKRHAGEKHDYVWQCGASLAAECLATGKEPLCTPEHALHVVEIMAAARESQAAGRRIGMKSSFKWPVVA